MIYFFIFSSSSSSSLLLGECFCDAQHLPLLSPVIQAPVDNAAGSAPAYDMVNNCTNFELSSSFIKVWPGWVCFRLLMRTW